MTRKIFDRMLRLPEYRYPKVVFMAAGKSHPKGTAMMDKKPILDKKQWKWLVCAEEEELHILMFFSIAPEQTVIEHASGIDRTGRICAV